MSMKVTILKLNCKNLNGNLYTREVGEDIVRRINEGKVLGGIGYPKDTIELSKISHVASNACIVDDEIVCDITILDTPEGRKLRRGLNKCVFRTYGEGEKEDEDDTIKNYQLISIVAIPIETDAFGGGEMMNDTNFQRKLLLLLIDLKRVHAIRDYKLFYKTSLKEAKDAIDKLMKKTSLWDVYWMDEEDVLSEERLKERVVDEEKAQSSTMEKLEKVIELLGESLSIIDDIQPIIKSPVCDQLCEIGEDISLTLTKLSKLGSDETREVRYGIAQDDGKSGFGFWDGPNPSLEAMLEVDGRDENSVIWRFNVDGTDDLIYRWDGDIWIAVGEMEDE